MSIWPSPLASGGDPPQGSPNLSSISHPQSLAEVMPFDVCVALYRTIEPQTHASLLALAMACPWMVYRQKVGARLMDALEDLTTQCTEEYVFYVDGDMVFGVQDVLDLFNALRKEPERGAVAGLYRKWAPPNDLIVGWRKGDGTWEPDKIAQKRAGRLAKRGKVEQVDMFGGGFILCRRDVFDKLEPPYFRSGSDEGGKYGQDTYFCKSLNEAGFLPSIHFGVQVGHIGPRVHTP